MWIRRVNESVRSAPLVKRVIINGRVYGIDERLDVAARKRQPSQPVREERFECRARP
jgi:hypothetical protein